MDLPLDVMVELYYDYCWDDIMTTGETSIRWSHLPHNTAVWLERQAAVPLVHVLCRDIQARRRDIQSSQVHVVLPFWLEWYLT